MSPLEKAQAEYLDASKALKRLRPAYNEYQVAAQWFITAREALLAAKKQANADTLMEMSNG